MGSPDRYMRAAQRLEQRFDAALGIVSSVDGRALGDAATGRVDQSGKPPHPGPQTTTTTTTTTTTNGAALAAAAFARLVQHGVERNPGPPKRATAAPKQQTRDQRERVDDPTSRTPEERKQHWETLARAQQRYLDNAKPGTTVYLRYRDESVSPPVVRTVALTFRTPLETFTLRPPPGAELGGIRRLALRQWVCEAIDLQTKRETADFVFPVNPHEGGETVSEDRELVTYIGIAETALPVDDATAKPLWEQRATPTDGTNFDGASIPVEPGYDIAGDAELFARIIAAIVAPYAAARAADDSAAISAIWHALLSAPKTRCRTLKGKAHTKTRARFRRAQLDLAVGQLLEQVLCVLPSLDARRAFNDDPDARHVSRAKRLAQAGKIGRGAAALAASNDVLTTDSDKMRADLEKLHPAGEKPSLRMADGTPLSALPAAQRRPTSIPSAAQLTSMVQSMRSGSSPGGTGWSEELLFNVLEHSEPAAKALAQMIGDLANGRVPADVIARLNACSLVALPKPDGGTRPIALSELFLKLASKLALAHDSEQLKRHFGDLQYGVSRPNGAETIIHETREFVRAHGKCYVQLFDFSNAFNSPTREQMWAAVRDFPALRELFAVEYAEPSLLRVVGQDFSLLSQRGSRQGTAAGGAFFCLALHPVLVAVAKIPGVRVLAYMDDITVLARTAAAAAKAAEVLSAHAATIGMSLNVKKCELLTNEPVAANEFPGVPRVSCAKLLGASVGFDNDAERKHLVDRMGDKFDVWFRRVRKCVGPYGSAMLAISGVPKAGFMMRVHHPEVALPLVRKFDDDIQSTWSEWAQCEVDEVASALAHLPTRLGGLGFTRMEQVANAAYTASTEAVFAARTGAVALRQAARMVGVNAELAKFVDDSGAVAKRLRELNMQPGSAQALRDPTVRAGPASFGAMLRLRLGAWLRGTPAQVECPGCLTVLGKREALYHNAACARVKGTNISSVHAVVKAAVKQLAHECLIHAEASEPMDLMCTVPCPGCGETLPAAQWSKHEKSCKKFDPLSMAAPRFVGPDIRLHMLDAQATGKFDSTVLDVTCVALMTASHPRGPEAEFSTRRARKETAYGTICTNANARLIVGAYSEHGVLSRDFKAFIGDIARNVGMLAHVACRRIQSAIQVAVGSSLANAERKAGLAYAPLNVSRTVRTATTAQVIGGAVASAALSLVAPFLRAATEAATGTVTLPTVLDTLRNVASSAPSASSAPPAPSASSSSSSSLPSSSVDAAAPSAPSAASPATAVAVAAPSAASRTHTRALPAPAQRVLSSSAPSSAVTTVLPSVVPTAIPRTGPHPQARHTPAPTPAAAPSQDAAAASRAASIAPPTQDDAAPVARRLSLASTPPPSDAAAAATATPMYDAPTTDSAAGAGPPPRHYQPHPQHQHIVTTPPPTAEAEDEDTVRADDTLEFGPSPLHAAPPQVRDDAWFFAAGESRRRLTQMAQSIAAHDAADGNATMLGARRVVAFLRMILPVGAYVSREALHEAYALVCWTPLLCRAPEMLHFATRAVLRFARLADVDGRLCAPPQSVAPWPLINATDVASFGPSPVRAVAHPAAILRVGGTTANAHRTALAIVSGETRGNAQMELLRHTLNALLTLDAQPGQYVSRRAIGAALARAQGADGPIANPPEQIVANVRATLTLLRLVNSNGVLAAEDVVGRFRFHVSHRTARLSDAGVAAERAERVAAAAAAAHHHNHHHIPTASTLTIDANIAGAATLQNPTFQSGSAMTAVGEN